jgi:hypothetical protein
MHLVALLTGLLVYWLGDPSVGQSGGRSVIPLVGRSVGRLVCCRLLVGWSVGGPGGCSVGYLAS